MSDWQAATSAPSPGKFGPLHGFATTGLPWSTWSLPPGRGCQPKALCSARYPTSEEQQCILRIPAGSSSWAVKVSGYCIVHVCFRCVSVLFGKIMPHSVFFRTIRPHMYGSFMVHFWHIFGFAVFLPINLRSKKKHLRNLFILTSKEKALLS